MLIEQSLGEVVDRLTILEIKLARIVDPGLRAHVAIEHEKLFAVFAGSQTSKDIEPLRVELSAVNESLWDVEDALRDHEWRKDFGIGFVELARSVYRLNDRRSSIKRRINEIAGSASGDVKFYSSY